MRKESLHLMSGRFPLRTSKMMAEARDNSFKESWRQNHATNDSILSTTVTPINELTFFSEMLCSGHRRTCLRDRVLTSSQSAIKTFYRNTASQFRYKRVDPPPGPPRINTLAAALIAPLYGGGKGKKRGREQKQSQVLGNNCITTIRCKNF